MQKVAIVILIFLVFGIIGYITFRELSIPEITYVSDTAQEYGKGNQFVVNRLYSSDVDPEKLKELLNTSLISTEFTDEEIAAAALAAGDPRLYLSFDFFAARNAEGDGFILTGQVYQQLAEGQKSADFHSGKLWLIANTDMQINSIEPLKKSDSTEKTIFAPVINEAKSTMSVALEDTTGYELSLAGTSGEITLQYTYDVYSSGVMQQKAIGDQFFEIKLKLGVDEYGAATLGYEITNGNTIANNE